MRSAQNVIHSESSSNHTCCKADRIIVTKQSCPDNNAFTTPVYTAPVCASSCTGLVVLRKHQVQSKTDLWTEDFVEGGIELTPKHCDECTRSQITHPLLPLTDITLETYWPCGDGPKALFVDYDGTLREFETRPELAVPTSEIKELCDAINAREDLTLHIISGRTAQFLETHFGSFCRFTLIAEHGFQIRRAGSREWEFWDHSDGFSTDDHGWYATVHAEMAAFVRAAPGSYIEEKTSALVWHYREVVQEAQAEATAANVVKRLESVREKCTACNFRITHGHKIVVVSHCKVFKGTVMRRLCEEKALFGKPYVSVLAAGDDVSDESMFDFAPPDFFTVKVGVGPTNAKFRVATPGHLRGFLNQLVGFEAKSA